MGSIDFNSVLTAWYNSKAGISASSSASGSAASSKPSNPTPPWSSSSSAAQLSALAQSVLNGGNVIDPTAAKLDVTGAGVATNQNYRNLFALYQGLSALNGLAQSASAPNVGSTNLQQIQTAFQAGVQQVQSFLGSNPFSGFQVFQGTVFTADQTTVTIAHETDAYAGATLYAGSAGAEVPAFQGAVKFDMTVTKVSGAKSTVSFDLSEMGSTTRTMGNVLTYLNGKLQAAGVMTRFSDQVTPGGPQSLQVGSTTIALPDSQDQYALTIQGVSTEKLSFSAPAADPAVYVGQTSGITSSSIAGIAPDATQQLVKFDASASLLATSNPSGQVFKHTLDPNIGAIQSTAASSDGSVYVLADVTGTTGGQAIQGAQDVALIKYDAAGNVVYTRTLGAASSASGFSLAVSSDGAQVAVAGSVTGSLDPGAATGATGASASPPAPKGFVTVFNAQGEEQWTQQLSASGGSGSGVQANAVAFGANGMVYVAGQSDGTISGGASSGGVDGFIQAFHAKSVPLNDGSGQSQWVVAPSYIGQFGTSGTDRATGLAVSGSAVYVSSVENGHAVVRRYDQSGTGSTSLTPAAVRDLGALQGGGVAGVAINADGSVIVAGSTHNGALNAGTVTQPYAAGEEAFIASLGADLQPASSDRLTYVGAASDQSATAMTVSGGRVYITGQIATTPMAGTGQTSAHDGYVAAIDPQTGQVTWSQQYAGLDRQAAPASIAVSQGGASILDRLGLPSGSIDYSVSQQLVANTSLRPGDEFFIRTPSGLATAVKIEAGETYQTLARKINVASGFYAVATVVPGVGRDQISIVAAFPDQQVQLQAGPAGSDALQMLGLREGVVSSTASQATNLAQPKSTQGALPPTNSIKNGYSLQLPSTLNLSDAAAIKQAQSALTSALLTIRSIYQDMTTPPPAKTSGSGTVPKYLSDQIANYQAGLARLTGGQ